MHKASLLNTFRTYITNAKNTKHFAIALVFFI